MLVLYLRSHIVVIAHRSSDSHVGYTNEISEEVIQYQLSVIDWILDIGHWILDIGYHGDECHDEQ